MLQPLKFVFKLSSHVTLFFRESSAAFDSQSFKLLFGLIPPVERCGIIGFLCAPKRAEICYLGVEKVIIEQSVIKMPISVATWLRE